MKAHVRICDAKGAADIERARQLFRQYQAWLGEDLTFQGFETELAELPGAYAPPGGAIVLARVDDVAVGCVAMRPLAPGLCEMKRLWVPEQFRGLGLGRKLVAAITARARSAAYAAMRLDTLKRLEAARELYRAEGFREIDAYYEHAIPDLIYLEKTF